MKQILLLGCCIAMAISSIAQISRGGEPNNWTEKDINRIDVEFEQFSALDMELVRAQDDISDQYKDTPFRFGIEHDVNYTPETHGTWEELEDGTKIWRLGVECAEATSLSFHLSKYNLEKGAELFIWDVNREHFLGSFNHQNNKTSGELPISLIHSEKAVIEYIIPSGVGLGELEISMVVQGYRGIINKFETDRGPYGNSGGCNINVNCPEGDEWQVEKNSVALIIQGGNAVCSGALVNNTANDGTPYFLTANHCLGNPTSWSYLFNHESSSCLGNSGPTLQTVSSGDLRASNAGSDFALIELSTVPPESYEVQYCGWDRSDVENVTGTTGIHHPSGDVMKICHDTDEPYHANQGGAAVWYIDEWEEGVTEGGSSGSPLFDQNHRIIGQLYGGFAACAGSVNNGQADWYGRFGVSWDGNSASTRLRDWLDPQGLAPLTWDGYPIGATAYDNDGAVSINTTVDGTLCGGGFYPGITLLNSGQNPLTSATITVTMNGNLSQTVNWTGNLGNFESEVIFLNGQSILNGDNTMVVEITGVNNTEDENSTNNSSSIAFPAVTGPHVILQVNLTLDDYGSETTWEIVDGNNVVQSGGPYPDDADGELVVTEVCVAEGCYDFVIYDSVGDGICCGFGEGSYTVENQFNVDLASGGDYGYSEETEICASITSVEDFSKDAVKMYPNPAETTLFIETETNDTQVDIFDFTGRVVFSSTLLSNGVHEVSLEGMAAGSYLVVTESATGQNRQVILKK